MGTIKPVIGSLIFQSGSTVSTTMSDDAFAPFAALTFHPTSSFTGTAILQVSPDGVLWNNYKTGAGNNISVTSGSASEVTNISSPFIRLQAPAQASFQSVQVSATRQPS